MQHDSVIWQTIKPTKGNFCSYRRWMSNIPIKWCKHKNNVLGICNELACPLANSRYATVRESRGKIYLYIKTIERAHTPRKMWEKILLSHDYLTALQEIDEHLIWWPKWRIHKCKLRLTKIHQFIIRSRKLATSIKLQYNLYSVFSTNHKSPFTAFCISPRLIRVWKPYEKQQEIRERKARIAAQISNVVKAELLERLHEGVYEGIYNFPQRLFNQAMEEKAVAEKDYVDEEEEDEKENVVERERNREEERAFLEEEQEPDDMQDEEPLEMLPLKEEELEIEREQIRAQRERERGGGGGGGGRMNFVGVIDEGLSDDDSDYETEPDIEDGNEPQIERNREIEYEYEFGNEMQMNVNVQSSGNRNHSSNRRGSSRASGVTSSTSILKESRSGSGKRKAKSVRWLDQETTEKESGRSRKKRKVSIGYD